MYLTAIDIGSVNIKALVADIGRDGRVSLLGAWKKGSRGLRRGEIVALDDLTSTLNQLFEEVKQVNKSALKNVFVNVSGANIKLQNSRGIVAVSRADNEIYQDDVERVIKASEAINLGPNRMILHTMTREFIIDGTSGILDPLGMIGNRLEVESLIIDSFKSNVGSLIKNIGAAGGRVVGLIYGPLAASRSVLSKNQKDLGAALVDIGAGTTGIAVYEENNLLHTSVLPLGTSNVTNDLAIGLRCRVGAAEKIKLSFGFALSKEISGKEKIDLHEIDDGLKSAVGRKFISEIIEVRLAEIFELVNNELKLIGKMGRLPAGAVLVGGGAKMPGIVELAKQEFKLPVQIGVPEIGNIEIPNEELKDQLEDPEFAVADGLLLWASDQSLKINGWVGRKQKWLSGLLKYFLP